MQTLGAILTLGSFYFIGVPVGLFLTFNLKLALKGLWIGLTVALFLLGSSCAIIVLRTDWNKEVERTRERLGAEAAQSLLDEEPGV